MLQKRIGRDGGSASLLIPDCAVSKKTDMSAEEIEKLVNRTLKAGSLLGGLNTCLTRSVIRCRLMRENGIDARVMLGLNKGDEELAGHSWVVWPGGPDHPPNPADYDDIQMIPTLEKQPGWSPEFSQRNSRKQDKK